MAKSVILLLDSFGIGSAADAADYGDKGADTLGHIMDAMAQKGTPLQLPNLARLGLGRAAELSRGQSLPYSLGAEHTTGACTYAQEVSKGKDTLSGHWEIAGVPVSFDWGYFPNVPNAFPPELVEAICREGNLPGILGGSHASGTEIIKELGEEHMATGKPIIYTSADSVLQIAAHEESFGLERLYDLCKLCFKLVQPYKIARVIARPFVGTCAQDFARTNNRHDYAVPAPQATLLDNVVAAGKNVYAVGKIADIFAHRGISRHYAAGGLEALVQATKEAVQDAPDGTLVFTNFVDFDSSYGHRRDAVGYGQALEYFDSQLPDILELLQPDDLLLITADHGNDPCWTGTDHTRERVPVLFSGAGVKKQELAPLATFSDMGQTIASFMEVEQLENGQALPILH